MLDSDEYSHDQVQRLKGIFKASDEQLKLAKLEQTKKAPSANMARKTGKAVVKVPAATAVSHPVSSGAGLPGDPAFD